MTDQLKRARDAVARIITLDHLQLLSDLDVDGDLYRLDPECRDGAYATADAILAILDTPPAPVPAPAAAPTDNEDGPCVEGDGCPMEMAVLKRFWRQHQSLTTDNTALVEALTDAATALESYAELIGEMGDSGNMECAYEDAATIRAALSSHAAAPAEGDVGAENARLREANAALWLQLNNVHNFCSGYKAYEKALGASSRAALHPQSSAQGGER